MLTDKSKLTKLTGKDISLELPDLKNCFESKSAVISDWIINWIKKDLEQGKIKETDLLPKKEEWQPTHFIR